MLSKKTNVRILALALVLMMAITALAGCSATNPNPTVLEVGSVKVGMVKYYSLFNSYKQLYSNYGIYDVSTADLLRSYQDIVFDQLAESYLPYYQALEAGITLTAEEEATYKANAQTELEGYYSAYAADVDASITDEAAIREAEIKLFKEDLRENGWTFNEYYAMIEENHRAQAFATKFMDGIYAERVNVTDDDVLARYNELVEQQTASYAEDPAQYYTDYRGFQDSGKLAPFVPAPEGYRFCKHILVTATEGEDIDAVVKEIQDKLAAGEDFDALVEQYGDDPGMKTEPYINTGYLVSNDIADKYYEGFVAAAMALENIGDVSEPVATEAGYHFIQYTSDAPSETVAYEEIFEDLKAQTINEAKTAVYNELIAQWTADTKIVKHYDRVSNVR